MNLSPANQGIGMSRGFTSHGPCLLPEVAQIPYGFILQLRAEQRVGLGQNGYQPEQVAADCGEDETGDNHSPVGSFGH